MLGGMLALLVIAGLLFWLLYGRASPRSTEASEATDYEDREAREELRAAEEEVRDLGTSVQPGDEQPGDDWGPGVGKPSSR